MLGVEVATEADFGLMPQTVVSLSSSRQAVTPFSQDQKREGRIQCRTVRLVDASTRHWGAVSGGKA